MKKYLILLGLIMIAFSITIVGQQKNTETTIEGIYLNDKPYKGDYKIFISEDGALWSEVEIKNNKFSIPLYLCESKKLKIKFLLEKHQFIFQDIYATKFGGNWNVGLNTKAPFPETYVSLEDQKGLTRLYYIEFHSTMIVFTEYD